LRNKLDDAVLDVLSVTLDRNPHCKLTPEDVHFIQKPQSTPDAVVCVRKTKMKPKRFNLKKPKLLKIVYNWKICEALTTTICILFTSKLAPVSKHSKIHPQ
jgi:hypothetical protein